ncbi:hypothetical protein [Streptomyces sp. HUAS TT20]|uniref:hypothetical protein n=1 Tax=Streptomyces sp. HUAS TT20 TaxID=3447509 RepID=UPI0021DA6850|nr:hypothetical protein [Streptomyces sp. HUAS 15-9]UXY25244.1 hypothetical protein N8I87_00740 [Streptomyces sp. HUAS 15-9]
MPWPGDRRPIVVGVDPDPGRQMASAWAADEAARRRLPLPTDFVGARHPQLEVDAVLAEGDAVRALCEQSRDATAVVPGLRGGRTLEGRHATVTAQLRPWTGWSAP